MKTAGNYLLVPFKYTDKKGKEHEVCFFIPKKFSMKDLKISSKNCFGVNIEMIIKDLPDEG